MSDRKVKVESRVRYGVVLSMPDFRFNRTFSREGQTALIDYEVMEEGLQRPGFRNIFRGGLIKVVDKQDRIDLGLQAADEEDEIEEILTLNTKEIATLLRSGDTKKIKDTLNKATAELIQRFVQVALNSKITDYNVTQAIDAAAKKKGLDIDMTELFKLAKDAERPVETDNE